MIGRDDIAAAEKRLAGRVRRTPVIRFGPTFGAADLWLKLEYHQHTGSFKARGAFNRLLAAAELDVIPSAGVVAASGGNAGLAVAHAAGTLGIEATVFVPENAPATKVSGLVDLGADVHQVGSQYAEAYLAAVAHAERTGALFSHPYDQPEICAGAGTLGLELYDQLDGEVDTVLVAVGGGGLAAGIAAALGGRATVVGVEPRNAPTLHAALAAGGPVDIEPTGVAADSLGARRLGEIAWRVATEIGMDSRLVTDEAITEARLGLWRDWRIPAEPGAAAAMAALTSGAYRPSAGERVCVVVCGANSNPSTLTAPG